MITVTCVLALSIGMQVGERLPTFGLSGAYGVPYLYSIRSIDPVRHEMLRGALVPGGGPIGADTPSGLFAVDLETGASRRIDLTQSGAIPSNGSIPVFVAFEASSCDHRFVLFHSPATNYGGPPIPSWKIGRYWLDRDSDGNGVYDEPTGRRVVSLDSFHVSSPVDYIQGQSGVSDDGRYVTILQQANGAGSDPVELRVLLGDLDADGDGVLGNGPATPVAFAPISVPTQGIVNPVRCDSPTINGDGRFIAYEAQETEVWITATGFPYLVKPPAWPFVRDVWVYDRDTDGNGIFDEAGGTSTIRANAALGALLADEFACAQVARSGDEVLFVHRAIGPQYSRFNTITMLEAFDLTSHALHRLIPTANGIGFHELPSYSDMPGYTVDGTGRFVSFQSNQQMSCGETSGFKAVRVDRDPDMDGTFDQPGTVLVETLQLLDHPFVGVSSSSPDGSILIGGFGTCVGNDSLDGFMPAILLRDCEARVRSETFDCGHTVMDALLYMVGCPLAGGSVLFEIDSAPTLTPGFLLVAAENGAVPAAPWLSQCPQFGLASPTLIVPLLPIQTSIGGATSAAIRFEVPAAASAHRFGIQGVCVGVGTGLLRFTRRFLIDVP